MASWFTVHEAYANGILETAWLWYEQPKPGAEMPGNDSDLAAAVAVAAGGSSQGTAGADNGRQKEEPLWEDKDLDAAMAASLSTTIMLEPAGPDGTAGQNTTV